MSCSKPADLKRGVCVEHQGALYTVIEASPANENADVASVSLRNIETGEAIELPAVSVAEFLEVELKPRWLAYRPWSKDFTDAFSILDVVEVPEEKLVGDGKWLDNPGPIGKWCLALYVDDELVSVGPDGFVELPDFIVDDGVLVRYTGSAEDVVVPDGVTAIGDKAFFGFSGRDQVRKVVLPEGLLSIGNESFYNCKNLAEIEMPSTIKRIGYSAFFGQNDGRKCKIRRLAFPASLEEIGDFAFDGCQSLEEVTFSEGLKHIGRHAFYHTSVKRFVLPASIEELGKDALAAWVPGATVELVNPVGKLSTREQLGASFVRFLPDDEEVWATVLAYQPGKVWMKAVGKKARGRSRSVLERSIELLAGEKKVSAKVGNNLAEFAMANIGALDDPVVVALHDLLEEKKLWKAAERIAAPSGRVVSKPKGQKAGPAADKKPTPRKRLADISPITRSGNAFIDIAVEFDGAEKAHFRCETYTEGDWLVVDDDGLEIDWSDGLKGWAEAARERTLQGVDLPVEEWGSANLANGSAIADFIARSVIELPACRFAAALERAGGKAASSLSFEAGFQAVDSRPEAAAITFDLKAGNTRSKRGYIPVCWGGTDPFEVASNPLGMYACITLGHYPKDNEWQRAPLEWLVIGEGDDSVLLIIRDVIDCLPIDSQAHKTTWEDCELRAWLNSDFLETAFSDEERALLQPSTVRTRHNRTKEYFETTDYVYILSREEAERAFNPISLGEAQPTPVAKSHDALRHLGANKGRISKKGACWMMRLPASKKTTPECFNPYGGECRGWGSVAWQAHGIRPVIRVRKSDVL